MKNKVKEVTIPACEGHEGLYSVKVKLYWICPVCGNPRGEVDTVRSYDGSQVLFCDGWKNPCGHIDYYSAVRKEAKENGLNEVKDEIL